MNKDKVMGMFLGVAIGDALGMPVETLTAQQIAEKYGQITEYIEPKGHALYDGWPAGRWTDDTQLTLAIAESLISKGKIDIQDIAVRSISAMDECDIGWGKSTTESLIRIRNGKNLFQAGNPLGAGNGVAMKVAPVAAFYQATSGLNGLGNQTKDIIELTIMTHKTKMAIFSAFAQILAVYQCLKMSADLDPQKKIFDIISSLVQVDKWIEQSGYQVEEDNRDLLWRLLNLEGATLERFSSLNLSQKAACFDGATCYVYNSLPFSLGIFFCNPHQIETLYDTVNAGGDTDTNGSMVGALLGALNGTKIFPQHLIAGLWRKDEIINCTQRFCERFKIKD